MYLRTNKGQLEKSMLLSDMSFLMSTNPKEKSGLTCRIHKPMVFHICWLHRSTSLLSACQNWEASHKIHLFLCKRSQNTELKAEQSALHIFILKYCTCCYILENLFHESSASYLLMPIISFLLPAAITLLASYKPQEARLLSSFLLIPSCISRTGLSGWERCSTDPTGVQAINVSGGGSS